MTVGLVWRGRSSAHVHVTYIYPLQCLRNPVISQEQEYVLRNSNDDCYTGELYSLPNWYANFAYLWEGVSIYISVSNYDKNECKMKAYMINLCYKF